MGGIRIRCKLPQFAYVKCLHTRLHAASSIRKSMRNAHKQTFSAGIPTHTHTHAHEYADTNANINSVQKVNFHQHTRPHQRVWCAWYSTLLAALELALGRFMFAGLYCIFFPVVHKCMLCVLRMRRNQSVYYVCAMFGSAASPQQRRLPVLNIVRYARGHQICVAMCTVYAARARASHRALALKLKLGADAAGAVVPVLFLIMVQTTHGRACM